MDEERPSVTAEGAAVMRALHQALDGEPTQWWCQPKAP
jgi:hypothetical protein